MRQSVARRHALVAIDLLAVDVAPGTVLDVLVGRLLGLGAAEAPSVGICLALALLSRLVLAGASQVHDLRHDHVVLTIPKCLCRAGCRCASVCRQAAGAFYDNYHAQTRVDWRRWRRRPVDRGAAGPAEPDRPQRPQARD